MIGSISISLEKFTTIIIRSLIISSPLFIEYTTRKLGIVKSFAKNYRISQGSIININNLSRIISFIESYLIAVFVDIMILINILSKGMESNIVFIPLLFLMSHVILLVLALFSLHGYIEGYNNKIVNFYTNPAKSSTVLHVILLISPQFLENITQLLL